MVFLWLFTVAFLLGSWTFLCETYIYASAWRTVHLQSCQLSVPHFPLQNDPKNMTVRCAKTPDSNFSNLRLEKQCTYTLNRFLWIREIYCFLKIGEGAIWEVLRPWLRKYVWKNCWSGEWPAKMGQMQKKTFNLRFSWE
jgi:hypothetical protein